VARTDPGWLVLVFFCFWIERIINTKWLAREFRKKRKIITGRISRK
jgi:preprotein translocase subunit SecY